MIAPDIQDCMASPNYFPEIFSFNENVTTPGNDNRSQDPNPLPNNNQPDNNVNDTKKSTDDDEPVKKSRWGIAFFTDTRWRIVFGITFIIIAAFLLVSVLSYFFTAAEDQSELYNTTLEQVVDNSQGTIKNIGGPGGALAAHRMVTHGLGLGAIPLLIYMVVIGLLLLGFRKCSFWSATFKALLLSVTLSMVFGFVCFSNEQIIPLGGYHGYYMNSLIIERFSWIGALAVSLILIGCVVGVYFYDIMKVYSAFKRRWDEQQARKRSAREKMGRILQQTDDTLGSITEKDETDDKTSQQQEKSPSLDLLSFLNGNKTDGEQQSDGEKSDLSATENQSDPKSFTNEFDSIANTNNDDGIDLTDSTDSTVPANNPTLYSGSQTDAENISGNEDDLNSDGTEESQNGNEFAIHESKEIEAAKKIDVNKLDPTSELPRYKMPSLDLLHEAKEKHDSVDVVEIEDKKNQIIEALSKYGIGISKIEATVGPTVTMYEIVPAEGVKIATIKRLEEDIAMALAALSTRIIAPIPGKSAIGIEVPNKEKQMVSVSTIFSSKDFQECKYELPIALGATIENEVFIADLAKMPHLLVAGATGKGKSVGMNIIINSLLYKKHPAELKFVLVDPKMVEFHPYRKLENHYLAQVPDAENAIITDTSKVIDTLKSLCVEMDERYKLLQKAEVVKITHYNDLYINKRLSPVEGHRFLPYIVVIVDEYADLVMTAGKEVETPIARLAQKARAVGMHVIIATQRPSANIITGIIKANFPARIAFKTSSPIDSKIILENSGAHQLIGNGDMLISQDGELIRVQCAFISTDEIKEVAQYIGEQKGFNGPFLLPDPPASGDKDGATGAMGGDWDSMLDEVARTVVTSGVASTSNVQRNFQIGYNRAGRIMDQLHVLGIVGPQQGSKPRDVLVDSYRLEEILQNKNNGE